MLDTALGYRTRELQNLVRNKEVSDLKLLKLITHTASSLNHCLY